MAIFHLTISEGQRTLGVSNRENGSSNGDDDEMATITNESTRKSKFRKEQLSFIPRAKSSTPVNMAVSKPE